MRILIVRLGALGDIVHTVPALAAIRRTWAGAAVDWLVDVRHRGMLEYVRGVDERIAIDTSRGWMRLPRDVRGLRRRGYDLAIDFQGLLKSAVLARASGARRVVGFARGGLREPAAAVFYTERYGTDAGQHVVRKNLDLVEALGADARAIEFPLQYPAPPASAEPYVLLNPGAGWPNKQWPPERFAELARWIRDRYGWRSIVLWGPREQERALAIQALSEGAAEAAPRTSIGEVLTLARGARLMVSGDTGPLHLAAAAGTPIVALFGPTNPARNGPFRLEDVSVSRFSTCLCHYERRCRRGVSCMLGITLDEVTRAVEHRLRAPL